MIGTAIRKASGHNLLNSILYPNIIPISIIMRTYITITYAIMVLQVLSQTVLRSFYIAQNKVLNYHKPLETRFAQTVSLVWIILKPLFWQYYESFEMFGSAPVYPIMAVILKHINIKITIIINNHYQSGYIYKCWQNIAEILSFCRNMGYRIIQMCETV